MNPNISNWISLVSAITAFLAYLEAKKATKKNNAIDVLTKIIEAADQTETYLTLRAEGHERDRHKENMLANAWSHASFLMRRIDKNLALRLSDKSQFWRAPETWSPNVNQNNDISLASVRADAERLLLEFA